MKRCLISAFAALALAGCETVPEKVLFVTDTALGVNFNANPGTLGLGYDRNEAYLAGRRPDGSIPPVVGFFESGGNIFDPEVRQLYATGNAAVVAASGAEPAQEPRPQVAGLAEGAESLVVSKPAKAAADREAVSRKMAVFGTTTSLGLKVGFGTQPYPDSFIFGYKRKEMSWIPVTERTVGGQEVTITPSVLAVIDSTIKTEASPADTGLSLRQFFATGAPADKLAKANSAMMIDSSKIAVAQVTAEGRAEWAKNVIPADSVMTFVSTGGKVDAAKLTCLADKANAVTPGISRGIETQSDPERIRPALEANRPISTALAAQIDNCKA